MESSFGKLSKKRFADKNEHVEKGKGKKKRFCGCMLLLSMIILSSSVAAVQAAATTTVSMPEVTKPAGSYATLPITIADVDNYGTGTISISYNPEVVHVTGVSGTSDSTVPAWKADNDKGIVNISAWNIEGVSGSIIFANVTFHAVGSPGSSTGLNLNVVTLKRITEEDIPVSVSDGTFNIEPEADTSAPTPTPSLSPSPGPGPTPTPSLTPPLPSFTTDTPPAATTPSHTTAPSPAPTGTGKAEATPAPTSTPGRKAIPGFEPFSACLAMLIACLLVIVSIKMRRMGGGSS